MRCAKYYTRALCVGHKNRVIEYNPGVSAVAIKNVTINDNFFPGHFPERPIMPGVLMVEVYYGAFPPPLVCVCVCWKMYRKQFSCFVKVDLSGKFHE